MEGADSFEVLVSRVTGHEDMPTLRVHSPMHALTVDDQANAHTGSHSDVAKGLLDIVGGLSLLVLIQSAHVHICVDEHLILSLLKTVSFNEMLPHGRVLPR